MQKVRVSCITMCGVALCMALFLVDCGGGNGDDQGAENPPSQQTLVQAEGTLNSILDVLLDALNQLEMQNAGALRATAVRMHQQQEPVNVSFMCATSGQASLIGTATATDTTFDFDLTFTFTMCESLNGALFFVGEGAVQGNILNTTLTIAGTVMDDACTLSFDDFTEIITFNEVTENTTGTIDGNFNGTCSNESFQCNFDRTDINDANALENSCTAI